MVNGRRFVYFDGREIVAATPVSFFEKLRASEYLPPTDLGRYLDLLQSRGCLIFGVQIDVGSHGGDLAARCQSAIDSMIAHGWVRVREESRSSSRAATC